MRKLLFLIHLTATAVLFSSVSYADGWGHHDHGWHHHHHHHPHYYPRTEIRYYYPQPIIRYDYPPPPPVRYIYPQPPPVRYYPQPQQYSNYDQRSHQGLAGGVIGSVFGYELGSGDPVVTGLGAAAGSFLGNEMGGGYPRGR